MSDNERDSLEDEYVQDDDMDMDDDSKPSVKEKDSDREVSHLWLQSGESEDDGDVPDDDDAQGPQILTAIDVHSKSNKTRITPSFMTKYERARIIGTPS